MKKKYIIQYRYTKYLLFETQWKEKTYTASDKNDLIEAINKFVRQYSSFLLPVN